MRNTHLIEHKVKCSICEYVFFIKLASIYNHKFEAIMNELGWYKNERKEWVCPQCEES